jgi:hypothetical protein
MMCKPKFKEHWLNHPDNSKVEVQPTIQQKYLLNKFITNDWHQHRCSFYSLMKHLDNLYPRDIPLTIIAKEE